MRIQKSERGKIRGRVIGKLAGRTLAVLAAAVFLFWCDPVVGRAEDKGTVLPKTLIIRKQPDQGSEQIASSSAGKEVAIRGKVDSSGVTWYQVFVDANTMGYVRADMIEVKGEGDIPTVSAAADTSDSGDGADSAQTDSADGAPSGSSIGSGTGAQVQAQEEMALQYGTTKVQAKVRPDPSTSNSHIDSLTPGTQVVVSGKSEGSDGKTWYFVNFTGANGSEKTGYIRSDLLELGEMLPVEEEPEQEPEAEQTEPEAAPRNEYELKIETNSEGEETWYIYDNTTGKKEKLLPLLESAASQSLGDEEDTDAVVKQRIVIVVLAVLLAALAVTVIVMAFKLRDAYYEDYEDDEEEEEERIPERRSSARERTAQREGTAARERTAQRERTAAGERAERRRESGGEERRRESAGTSRTERRAGGRKVTYQEEAPVRTATKRKTKNFLMDDDEFEFEFLNMDDKDLK